MINADLQRPETWRQLVSALRDGAPPQTSSIEFRGTLSRRSYGGLTLDDGASRDTEDMVMDALDPLSDLAGDTELAISVLVGRAGDAQVDIVESRSLVDIGSGSAVLDTVLLVAHEDPEPYRRQPVRHDGVTTSPNADPDVVRSLVRRALPQAQPATGSQLAAVESAMGMALPQDVRALYETAGAGDLVRNPDREDLLYGLRIYALDDEQARSYLEPKARYLSWRFGATAVVSPDPAERVQPLATSPAWFAIGDDWGGNAFVVDLLPGPRGHVGQVLFVDHESNAGAQWLAPSLTELLTQGPTDVAGGGSEDGLVVRIGRSQTMADVRPETEVVVVGIAASSPVDFGQIAGHGRIRTVKVDESAGTVSLEMLASLPGLEYLELDVPRWQQLLDADQVPATLQAAGLSGFADWAATVELVNTLLGRWGRPRIAVTQIRLAATR